MSTRSRSVLETILSWIFRVVLKPFLFLLPSRHQAQVITIAHYIKTVCFYGEILNFGMDTHVAPPELTQEPEPSAAIPPAPQQQEDELPANVEKSTPEDTFEEKTTPPIVPSWVVDELRQLAGIEPDLFPTPEYLARFHLYQTPARDTVGRVYAECYRLLAGTEVDILFIAPWLKRGGADLGTLHHLGLCRELGLQAALITTLDVESPWLERVPEGIPVVELGRRGRMLSEEERMLILARLVLQIPASTLHIIQSQLGWETLATYGKAFLAEHKSVFASLYSEEQDANGLKHGYAPSFLASTLPYLSGIISDNGYYAGKLIRDYGVDPTRMHIIYFPSMKRDEPYYTSVNRGKILWASRIAVQKRPDLLLRIAAAMPDIEFHVRGHAEHPHEQKIEAELQQLPNVTLTGSYELGELVDEEHRFSLFLYTSEVDGIPNVLLEATMAGLPIVAPTVGGIPELIHEDTGYLVSETESVNAYVCAIREALAYPGERHRRWRNAVELLTRRHSYESFCNRMTEIEEYFPLLKTPLKMQASP